MNNYKYMIVKWYARWAWGENSPEYDIVPYSRDTSKEKAIQYFLDEKIYDSMYDSDKFRGLTGDEATDVPEAIIETMIKTNKSRIEHLRAELDFLEAYGV